MAIPVPERRSQGELNSEQCHQVVDQVTGWDSDQFNEVLQKYHQLSAICYSTLAVGGSLNLA
jgi:hypothetical protein